MTAIATQSWTTPVAERRFIDRHGRHIATAFAVLGALALVTVVFWYEAVRIGATCLDGPPSSSIGSGTCSWRGGIDEYLYERTLFGMDHQRSLNLPRWILAAFGVADLGVAATLFRRSRRFGAAGIVSGAIPRLGIGPATQATKHEMHVTVERGRAGRTVTISGTGRASTTAPFFFDHDPDRGGPTLAALMARPKRRLARRGRSAIETYGSRLFDALLPEPLRSAYRAALAEAIQDDARLRIVLNLDDQTADLPWEYLYDDERASFLALSNDTSLLRTVVDSSSTRPPQPIDELRVLVMTCSPTGLDALDTASELDRIETKLAPYGDRVHVRPVHGETFEDLRLALDDFAPHVFHFVGHGHWDTDADDGALAFVDSHGGHQPVTGRELGVLLNRPGLRLALLNSCDGARTSQQDRFAGVATSLVAQGVPAAIGMQYRIDDDAAAAFGSEFLAALVDVRSVDAALTAARIAVYTSRNATEWGTPVCTTRVPVDDLITWLD